MANALSNFFITITEKLNIHHTEKGDAVTFPVIFLRIEILTITEDKVNGIVCP